MKPRHRRLLRDVVSWLVILSVAFAALPPWLIPSWLPTPAPKPAAAETLNSPRHVAAALMPNGQVGLIFANYTGTAGEIRFVRYTDEHAIASSVQLSTAFPWYPQIAVIGSTVVAAYVDTRSPNSGKLIFRTSTDSGASWSGESNPFGTEIFDTGNYAPRLVASHDGATLYVFTAASGARPNYRYTTNLTTWSSPAAAGDTSMRVVTGNNCGSAGQECYRAHNFSFMETATAGTWIYVTKSDAGSGQSGRGTQVGSLGGSWSTQVDHGGSGGGTGAGGESTATTFLGRDGSVYYVRAGGSGENLYYQRSTDGGATWNGKVYAYAPDVSSYVTAAPVGLYVPGYTWGEYVWYAGFGGSEDTLRVVPLWQGPQLYSRTGTVRMLGSAGSDLDAASAFPYNFGDAVDGIGAGGYSTSQTDLALPGRLLPLAFTRTYNSGDPGSSALAPGWTHSYDWSLQENGDTVTLKRGSGERDRFTRNTDGTYARPPGVFDTLSKNTDGTFTLTTPQQIQYEFGVPATAYSTLIGNATPVGYWRLGESSGTTVTDATSNHLNGTYSGTYTLHLGGAIVSDPDTSVTFAGGYADMGSPSALNISGTALSIEFWAKGSPGTYNYLVSHTNGANQGYAVYTGGDAQYHFYIGRSGGAHVTGSVTGIWDQQWHHIVNLYDGAAMKIYVDGVAKLTETETASITGYTGNFSIARYNGGGYSFSGSLDEVTVYSRVLSSSEINDHYLSGLAPKGLLTRIHEPSGNQITLGYTGPRLTKITDTVGRNVALGYDSAGRLQTLTDNAGRIVRYGLDDAGRLAAVWDRLASADPGSYADVVLANSPAAYWRLGETSGTTAVDASGNGVTGTYNGTYTLGVTGAISRDTDKALSVAGSGYVSASGSGGLNLTGSGLTIEGWFKGASQNAYANIVSKSDGTGSVGYSLYVPGSGTLGFLIHTQVSGQVVVLAPTSPWDNQWHYVVATYDGSMMRLYVDGAVVAQAAATGTITSSSSVALNLGRYNGGGQTFSGSLDEVAVTASALSQTDISARLYGRPSWKYSYAGVTRHVATVTDPDARTAVTNTYDSLGRLATQADGLGHSSSLAYGSSTTTITDPRGHDTVQSFDARSRLTQVADVVGSNTFTLAYTYDTCGNRASATDRNGNRTDYTYDTACKGNLLELQEPQLNPQTPRFTTDWTYDSKNNPIQKTDAKGFVSTWTYDATTNVMLSATVPIDASTVATTKWVYADSSNPGLPTRVIAPRGNTTGTPDNTYSTVLAYDSSGNLTSSTDADGDQTTYAYDSSGRRTSMVDPDGNASGGTPGQHTWSTGYDALDRVMSSTDPLTHSSTSTYDRGGHVKTATDKNGNVTTYTYDAAGRLSTVAQKPDPSGQPSLTYTTTITRDNNGNATTVTQANGVVTDYAYDALNRLTSMSTHPASGTNLVTTYALDGNGNTVTRTTADSVATTYTYDNLSRLTNIAASGLSSISYGYDELSRRTSMTDGTGTTTYTYDRMGRLTQAAQPNGTVSYGYDRDSNRTTLTYPGSSTVTYTFSSAGRLSSLVDWGSRTSSYTYYPSGLAATVTLPNGLVTSYTYDRAQRLMVLTNVVGSTTITSHSYTLDAAGNRTAQTEFVSGITTGASDSFGYTYDGLNRLTAVTTTNAESFTLDAASNIASRTGPSATYSYDTSNRLTSDGSSSFTWSNADRLTARGSDTFGYDPLDRLTSSTVSGTSRTYTYSADGLLESRTQGGSTTSFLWDPATSPSRLLQVASDKIVYGLGPLYAVTGSGTTTFARDGGKSVRAELASSGSVVASFRFSAYGRITQSSGASTPSYFGHAGQLIDPSGLYYMRGRWYEASTGRFISRDPVQGFSLQPSTLNTYTYAGANPVVFADPTGQFCIPCLILIGYVVVQLIPTAVDVYQTVKTFQDPATDAGERAGMVALTVAGAIDPIGGGYAAFRASTRSSTRPPAVTEGETVYRVHGGEAAPEGHSWTPTNPKTMTNPRDELGLPNRNTGEYVTTGRVRDWTGVTCRRAVPCDGTTGGAIEYLIPRPEDQIEFLSTERLGHPY